MDIRLLPLSPTKIGTQVYEEFILIYMPEFIFLRVSHLLIFIHILLRKQCFGAITTLRACVQPSPGPEVTQRSVPTKPSSVSPTLPPGSLGTQPAPSPLDPGAALLWLAVPCWLLGEEPSHQLATPGCDRVCRSMCCRSAPTGALQVALL